MSEKVWVIIPAAGIGQRMQSCLPKQYMKILGKTVLEHSLSLFADIKWVEKIVLVLSPEDKYWHKLKIAFSCPLECVVGGEQRYDSVSAALASLKSQVQVKIQAHDWVIVHDAARPCLQIADIEGLKNQLAGDKVGGLLATPVRDTLKLANANQESEKTVSREHLWHALTPQMFRFGVLDQAFKAVHSNAGRITDEASAVELIGLKPRLIKGRQDNIKITEPGDLQLAELILKKANRIQAYGQGAQ